MSPRPFRPVVALAVCGAMCAGCFGRQHTQHEGAYGFTAQEILRDDCGLQHGSTTLWSGEMRISGDIIRMQMDDRLYGMQAAGFFLYGVEQFTLDGTAEGPTLQVSGTDCQVTLVQAHLDATTDSARDFHGMGDVQYRADLFGCSCHLSARFSASML